MYYGIFIKEGGGQATFAVGGGGVTQTQIGFGFCCSRGRGQSNILKIFSVLHTVLL